jgi:hypothetical protein
VSVINSLCVFEANAVFAFSGNSVFLEGEEEVWWLNANHTSSVRILYIHMAHFCYAAILPQNGIWLPSASFAKGQPN